MSMMISNLREQLALLENEFGDSRVYLLGDGERTSQIVQPALCWDVRLHEAFVLLRPQHRADFLYGGDYYVIVADR